MRIELSEEHFDLWLKLLGQHIDNMAGYASRLKSEQRRVNKLDQMHELIVLETTLCAAAGIPARHGWNLS